MKMITGTLLLVTCAVLVGCGRSDHEDREILNNLTAIKQELGTNRAAITRWAFVNRREIQSAIDKWSEDQILKTVAAETLPAEQAEKLKQYEALRQEFGSFQQRTHYYGANSGMPGMPMTVDPMTGLPIMSTGDTNTQKEFEIFSDKLTQALIPVASLLERRSREAEQIRNQYTPGKLAAEYVGDRFDLVIDSGDSYSHGDPIVYRRAGEAVDITAGVLTLWERKTKK